MQSLRKAERDDINYSSGEYIAALSTLNVSQSRGIHSRVLSLRSFPIIFNRLNIAVVTLRSRIRSDRASCETANPTSDGIPVHVCGSGDA